MLDAIRPDIRRLNAAIAPLALGAAVFLLALGCLTFTREFGRVAAVWPVNAIVIAVILRAAPGAWPRYLVAGLLGNIAADLAVGDRLITALELSACNSLEIAICVGLSRRMVGRDIDLGRPRDLVMFLLTAGALAPLAAATCAVLTLSHLRVAPLLPTLFGWYAPDALGLLIVTPALLALTPEAVGALDRSLRNRRGALSMLAAMVSLVTVFGQERYPILFLVPPALIFVAFELNLAGAALALLATATVAVVMTLTGHGPAMLIKGGLVDKLAVLQVFLATLTVSVLPVAAALAKRRRLEEELRGSLAEVEAARAATAEANRITSMAQDVAGVGYWRRGRDAMEVTWSDQTFRLHGMTPGDATPNVVAARALYHPEDQPRVTALVEHTFATGEPFDMTVRLRRQDDDQERLLLLRGEAERNAEGAVVAMVGVMRDVTEEVTARQRIEASETRFRLLAESATDVVMQVDQDDIIRFISPSVRRYGHQPEDMVGKTGASFIHSEDVIRILDRVRRIAAGERLNPKEERAYRFRKANGDYTWLEGNSAVVRDAEGRKIGLVSHLRDVSDQLAAKAALEASEARFRLLTESSPDIVLKLDRNDVVQYASPSCRRYGYEPGDLVGVSGYTLVHPDDLPKLRGLVGALFTGAEADRNIDRSYRLRIADGSYVWMEGNPAIIRDESGAPQAVISQLRDISERHAANEALADSEARYRLLTDNATDVIACFGTDSVFTFLSPAAETVLGYAPEELVGKHTSTIIHPDDMRMVVGQYRAYLAAGPDAPALQFEYRAFRRDGTMIWLEARPTAVYDEVTGELAGFQDVVRDITARKQVEAALAESELRYRVIAENATDIISRTGVDDRLIYLSPSIEDVTGYSPAELIGNSLLGFIHPDDLKPTLAAYRRIVAGTSDGKPIAYRARHKDGHWIWLECNPTLVRDADGDPMEFIDVTRDVSARVRLEEELRAARDAAQEAAAVKSDFMANMSHEIRTPLTAILGFTSLLAGRSDLDVTAQNQVQRVSAAGQALLSIVNDVLDFSKLEAGQVEIAPRPASPAQVLRDALSMFAPQAEAKGLTLAFAPDDSLPQTLLIDPDRLRQILLNLIGNALKFTERGTVRVTASYVRKTGRLKVAVEDTGAGMTRAQQQKLFQRFSQVDASSTRRHGGTGLGLAICRGLAEAMDGEIGVRSRPGRGSVFQLQIAAPIAEALAAGRVANEMAERLADVRVLVVDDNPVNRELARAVLEGFGAEVTEAEDGIAGVEAASLTPVDVILMDLRMPRLNGPEALARIRAGDGPNQATPILAFTADLDLDRLRADHGFEDVIRKPIVPNILAETIQRSLLWDDLQPDLESPHAAAS